MAHQQQPVQQYGFQRLHQVWLNENGRILEIAFAAGIARPALATGEGQADTAASAYNSIESITALNGSFRPEDFVGYRRESKAAESLDVNFGDDQLEEAAALPIEHQAIELLAFLGAEQTSDEIVAGTGAWMTR